VGRHPFLQQARGCGATGRVFRVALTEGRCTMEKFV
jgi:hypothetical protein